LHQVQPITSLVVGSALPTYKS